MADTEISEAAEPAKSHKKLILFAVLLGVVLLGGGGAGTLWALGMLPGGRHANANTPGAAAAEIAKKDPIYVPLDPPFTVNFNGGSTARFLQVSLQAMTRNPDVVQQVKKNMPVIRNDLTMLFSSQSAKELATIKGKEKLRAETLASIQHVLKTETGKPGVEAVYFTSFVMQ